MAQHVKLKKMVENAKNIVFFGGAGVSTESGIPDFRSVDGLYNQKFEYPPETILSHSFYMKKPDYFYRFYREKMLPPSDVKPNITHEVLARWEEEGKLSAVITQNIDGLHQAAGSKNVLEVHGSIHRNNCMKCGSPYSLDEIRNSTGIPCCTKCGGAIKPAVTLYDEALDQDVFEAAKKALRECDLFIVAGSSLTVFPAAGLVNYYLSNNINDFPPLVIINLTKTPYDRWADLVIHEKLGDVFNQF